MCSGFVTHDNTRWHTSTRYDSFGRAIGPSQKPRPDTQHSQKIYVHAAGRIRTRNRRKRAAADPLRGHRDRPQKLPNTYIYVRLCTNLNSIDFRDSSLQLNINNYNQLNNCAAVPQLRQLVNGTSNDGGPILVSKCSFGVYAGQSGTRMVFSCQLRFHQCSKTFYHPEPTQYSNCMPQYW